MAHLHRRLKALYKKEGGAFADPILNLTWPYRSRRALAGGTRQGDQRLRDRGPEGPDRPEKVLVADGQQVAGFAHLRDDGKTACGCWIYSGCFNEAGNMMARRDNADPGGPGVYPNWAFSWPANRRILYNRASCRPRRQALGSRRKLIEWNGRKWTGYDVPDFAPTAKPDVRSARSS